MEEKLSNSEEHKCAHISNATTVTPADKPVERYLAEGMKIRLVRERDAKKFQARKEKYLSIARFELWAEEAKLEKMEMQWFEWIVYSTLLWLGKCLYRWCYSYACIIIDEKS